jgi:uncharacterized delta-60 repeat protein
MASLNFDKAGHHPSIRTQVRTTTTLLLLGSLHCVIAQPGTVDTTFHSRLQPGDGQISTVLALPDGKAIIGGSFTIYDGETVGRIARLGSNGALDGDFESGTGFDADVSCAVRQADGRILVGGRFGTYDGTPRPMLTRLNADGGIDDTFQPDVADLAGVRHLAVLPTGRILVSGYNLQAPFIGLRQLMPDGSLDTSFSAPADIWPNTFIVLNNGGIMVGESKQTPPFQCLTRLLENGSFDDTFTPRSFGMVGLSYAAVNAIHAHSDGAYIVGGHFDDYDGVARKSLARIHSDGSLDLNYDPVDATWPMPMWWAQVNTILPCDGDKLMIPKFGLNARLQEDGLLDGSFHQAIAPKNGDPRLAYITGSARQADGKILVAGDFDDIDSTGNPGIARLHDCTVGAPCDDGDPQTLNDIIDGQCTCAGELSIGIPTSTDGPSGFIAISQGDGSGRFTISGTFPEELGPIRLTVQDLLGRKIHDERIRLTSGPTRIEVLPVIGISYGHYVVTLTATGSRWTQLLVLP